MALSARSLRLSPIFQPRALLSWGGALAVGLAAVNWRSILRGDIREMVTPTHFRNLNSRVYSTINSRSSFFSIITSNSPMFLTPPQSAPSWNHSAEDILRLTKELIEKDRAHQDKIGLLAPKDCNFNSVGTSSYTSFNLIVYDAFCRRFLWVLSESSPHVWGLRDPVVDVIAGPRRWWNASRCCFRASLLLPECLSLQGAPRCV